MHEARGSGGLRLQPVCLILALLSGCGRERAHEIREVRSASQGSTPTVMSSAERFGWTADSGTSTPGSPAETAAAGAQLTWRTPPGWRDLPPTPMRLANFAIDGEPDLECYVSVLPGGGGGLAANLDRWRKQMSLPGFASGEIERLPTRDVLGQAALQIDLSGTYRGMSGDAARSGYELVGAALEHRGQGVFVKMLGPAASVRRERPRFDMLCASLADAGGDLASNPHIEAAGRGFEPGRLTWIAPAGWVAGQAKPMRLVTFTPAGTKATECWISVLSGDAGGAGANINRWRQQMGQPVLDPAALQALPRLPMLGTEARLVQVAGDYAGMDGGTEHGYMLLGAVCPLGGSLLFVKMIGPEAEVRTERARFESFCKSLR